MRDSERYIDQADAVTRMAGKAANEAERDVYMSIADGWRRLAAEASRSERRLLGEPPNDILRHQEG